MSIYDPTESNYEAALRSAMAVLPPDAKRRIVMIGDFNETRGRVLQAARVARESGVVIDTIPLAYDYRREVMVESLVVQPEANDVARLVREHGDRLSFWGTVGDQSVLPYGTPEEVRQQVRSRIETVGRDGGLMVAPAHVVEPEVPVENVFAFFEAVEEFGRYA